MGRHSKGGHPDESSMPRETTRFHVTSNRSSLARNIRAVYRCACPNPTLNRFCSTFRGRGFCAQIRGGALVVAISVAISRGDHTDSVGERDGRSRRPEEKRSFPRRRRRRRPPKRKAPAEIVERRSCPRNLAPYPRTQRRPPSPPKLISRGENAV